jgi:hypothetical protein
MVAIKANPQRGTNLMRKYEIREAKKAWKEGLANDLVVEMRGTQTDPQPGISPSAGWLFG